MAASDVDTEWLSMKEEYSAGSKKSKNIAHLWEVTPTQPSSSKSNTTGIRRSKKLFEIINGLSTSCSNRELPKDPLRKQVKEERPSINTFASSLFENDNDNDNFNDEWRTSRMQKREFDGDSDDDSDLDSVEIDTTSPYPNMKIERLANMLQSEERKVRLEAIGFLENEIRSLMETMKETVPPLRSQPPYSIENICLTHKQYDATVSDLAKGDHVSGWHQWQRTQVPITHQFPERPPEETSPDESVHVENDGNVECSTTKQKLQTILNICGSALFQRFSDPVEKCRVAAIECVRLLCLSGLDFGKHIAYLMPAIFSKYPETKYDPEMQMFVSDSESHAFYKRGGATQRQDRKQIVAGGRYSACVGELSEEVRLQLCELLSCILRSCIHLNVLSLLDAYFTDLILAVQSALNDPFVKLKTGAAELMIHILRLPNWEDGAKYYATAIARAALPYLRHRSARVRIAFIGLFEASISVPNREKIKGAGTEAIVDLVGFREENVLPIAAFYKAECGVTVNSLAELMIDKNMNVRYRCCQMLAFLICCLPDRYDHHQRLLPYLLSFYNDEHQQVREQAIMAVEQCGHQYEAENPNDIIERRQYGVDGDKRCNHVDKLPSPFKQRPRVGARLFVRGNTKRFFSALLSELRSWMSKTRNQSAKLIHILVFYCEEHLTMDFHDTLTGIVKSLQSCLNENDKESRELQVTLESLLVSMGRYVDPDTYVKLLVPRIIGDIHSGTSFSDGGYHSELSCVANAIALRCLVIGSLPRRVLSHFFVLLPNLSSQSTLGDLAGSRIRVECLKTLNVLFQRATGHSINGAQTAHFEETGRLCSGNEVMKSFKLTLTQLLVSTSDKEVIELVTRVEQNIPHEFDDCRNEN
jgi:hypothetical protein